MAIDKTPVQVGDKEESTTGLKMFRLVDYFRADITKEVILVWYYEFLITPTGAKVEEKYKHYVVKDTPAILDENGVETLAAFNEFTAWADLAIDNTMVGARLGSDIILGAIKNTLSKMAFDAPDGYITVA